MANELILGSQEDAENCEYVVCIRVTEPLAMPDNLISACCQCGSAIQHRPHIPKTPSLICLECILPDLQEAKEDGALGILITPATKDDLLSHLAKKMN